MIVIKFGGTSVKDGDAIRNVAGIIKTRLDKKPLIVVSALAGITNLLVEAISKAASLEPGEVNRIVNEIRSKHYEVVNDLITSSDIKNHIISLIDEETTKLGFLLNTVQTIKSKTGTLPDAILSTGEILSSNIINGYLQSIEIKSGLVDARSVMVIDTSKGDIQPNFGMIKKKAVKVIPPLLEKNECVVCAGFIGLTEDDEPATLGRNGSDYTASILCSVLDGNELEIWSDVDGILSADPSIVPDARLLKSMSFNEACELAYFGARVLHPATIQPALEKNIPVKVLNTHKPSEDGTLITKQSTVNDYDGVVKSIAYKEGITLLNIESSKLLLSPGLIEEIFLILAKHGKRVYAIWKSATKLSVTIEDQGNNLQLIVNEISKYGEVTAEKGKTIMSIVGERMIENPSLPWQILKKLDEEKIKINLISQHSSHISLVFIINEEDINRTVKFLHEEFIAVKQEVAI